MWSLHCDGGMIGPPVDDRTTLGSRPRVGFVFGVMARPGGQLTLSRGHDLLVQRWILPPDSTELPMDRIGYPAIEG